MNVKEETTPYFSVLSIDGVVYGFEANAMKLFRFDDAKTP